MNKPSDLLKPLSVPAVDILRIFQLQNPNIYDWIENEEQEKDIYDFFLNVLTYFESSTAPILEDTDAIIGHCISLAVFESSAQAMSMAIKRVSDTGEEQDWLFFAMTQDVETTAEEQNLTGQSYTTLPLYILSGTVDKNKQFIPYDSMCFSSNPSSLLMGTPLFKVNEQEFFSTIMYADAALIACFLGHTVETDLLETLLDSEQAPMARNYYQSVKNRTAQGFSQEIMRSQICESPVSEEFFTEDSFVMAPPPMPQ